MCGRFTLTVGGPRVAALLGLPEAPALPPRYNIAPTQTVFAVRPSAAGREPALLRWGLPPAWPGAPAALINARAETAADKPAFRDAFKRRRCLVPLDGFYEWQKVAGGRRGHHFRRPDGAPFAAAALWDGAACALLTTAADAVVAPVHDRMPLVLAPADFALWLDAQARPEDVRGLLSRRGEAGLEAVAVGPWVNDARREGPRCLQPAERSLFDLDAG